MLMEMVIGAGIFVMGTLFGWMFTKNDSELELQFKNLMLEDNLRECRKKDEEKY